MKVISVLDTTIASYNLGNEIIMDAINSIVEDLFKKDFVYKLAWEGGYSRTAIKCMTASDHIFFGGTNALSSHVLRYKQMGFRLRDILYVRNLTLLGVGWWQYQGKPDLYTRFFFRGLLNASLMHSVRDSYTKEKLESMGISNVLNTCCPTTWGLTPEHCAGIPTTKVEAVVVTLTDYNQQAEADYKLLCKLMGYYKKIYYWVQGVGDKNYIESFKLPRDRVEIIDPNLRSYDEILGKEACDYIGLRLHAGIRAIQYKKRALILAVDNRATEISRDIGLNVVERSDMSGIEKFIQEPFSTKLNIPFEAIEMWKSQFKA